MNIYNLVLTEDELILLWKYMQGFLADNEEYNKFNKIRTRVEGLMDKINDQS